MSDLQRFKENDEIEMKMIAIAMPTLEDLGEERDEFFEGAFTSFLLGDVLYDLGRDPMSGVITREIFRESFPAIHQLFTRPGTFEFYLTVFRSVWGDDVDIEFDIPSPGYLVINANALALGTYNLVSREIVDDEYVHNNLVTQDAEQIITRSTFGIKTQSEIDALMNELSPEGIFVEANLTI